jgi:hypothetical protein
MIYPDGIAAGGADQRACQVQSQPATSLSTGRRYQHTMTRDERVADRSSAR